MVERFHNQTWDFGLRCEPSCRTHTEPVLAHRIILRPNAEMQGQSAGKLVAGLLEREHVPQMAYDG